VGGGPAPDFTTTLLRTDDLLSLTLNFFNLQLSSDKKELVPIHPGQTSYISADFGPQHVLEEAFEQSPPPMQDPSTTPPAGSPIRSLIAGKSRVVFVVPAGNSIGYSVEGLLAAFGALPMNVAGNALPADGVTSVTTPKMAFVLPQRLQRMAALRAARGLSQPSALPILSDAVTIPGIGTIPIPITLPPPLPAPPAELDTALELPTRLVLSPNQFGGWAHALGTVTSPTSGRTEVWHTRLGVLVNGAVDESNTNVAARTVRAIWTRDPGAQFAQDEWARGVTNNPTLTPPNDLPPFPASLTPQDRVNIVFESSNFGRFRHRRSPKAVNANRLMLSALGGWLDLKGDFGDKTQSSLLQWEHRATMGRDHYVKVVTSGVLYPWGNRAVLIKITERRLTNGAEALWTHFYIVVKQPTVVYDDGGDPGLQKLLRQFQFTEITFTTLSTPELDGPSGPDPAPIVVTPLGGTSPYLFKMVGKDHTGRDIHLEVPAVWTPTKADSLGRSFIVYGGGAMAKDGGTALQILFDPLAWASPTNGQRIAFAPESADPKVPPGKTTFETHSVTHGSAGAVGFPYVGESKPPFVPQMANAAVAVEALRGFGNHEGTSDVSFHPAYIDNAFDPSLNGAEAILGLKVPPQIDFSQHSDKTGGFMAPNMAVTALSRISGPVGGSNPANIASGAFDPSDFFSGLLNEAKVFGVFTLDKIIPIGDLLNHAPKFITDALNEIDTLLADAHTIENLLTDPTVNPLPPQLSAIQSLVTTIETQATAIVSAVASFATTADATDAKTAMSALKTALDQLPGDLDNLTKDPTIVVPGPLTQLRSMAASLAKMLDALDSTIEPLLTAYQDVVDFAKTQTFKLEWSTPLKPFVFGGQPLFDPKGNKSFFLKAEMRLKATGGKPAGVDLVCGIDPFDINLLGSTTFITVHVQQLQFELKAGSKADVSAALAHPGIEFKGPLSFVQTLTSIIPLDGFTDPPGIDVDASGITASFSLPIPSLAIGVFALTNISIGASLHVPFIGATPLNVGFNFCTRDEPFHLTIMFIGGGGFFGVTFDPNGIEVLEAAFEAGASLSVDFGVASGSISAMIGVYFKMESSAATLTGYFRLRGEVDVLGIITASIELYLELTYESASGKVTGHAELTIDVKIVFFHIGVKISCTKRFAGGNGDPSFLQMMQPWGAADVNLHATLPTEFANLPGYDPWNDYLLSFAA
jgi:hypothetical protein